MMEYTTPPSYGSTKVNIGAILKDDEIVYAGVDNKATHTASETDPDSDWPEPTSIKWEWAGKTADGQDVSAGDGREEFHLGRGKWILGCDNVV